MTEEAKLVRSAGGLVPEGDGWFVLNVADACWRRNERFGDWVRFEGAARFPQLGVNVHVLQPDQPACMYHSENQQEAFLVLAGECLLLVEEQERRLRAWDFFHCPPGTRHVFVGAGDGPCAILMLGARLQHEVLDYPESELARRRGAGVARRTPDPRQAYAGTPPSVEFRASWPLTQQDDPARS